MGCPAPGVPISGSVQRNKMFGAIGGGGVGGQPNFMQHGGGNNIAATYMQNKLRSQKQGPGNQIFGMAGNKSSQQSMDSIGNEDSVHQVD